MKLDLKNFKDELKNIKLDSFLKLDVDKLKAMIPQKKADDAKGTQATASKGPGLQLPKSLQLGLRFNEMSRYLSNNALFEKAVTSFDRSALIVVGVAWLVAAAMMGLTFMSVKQASDLKMKVTTAQALEPFLPKINRVPLNRDQYAPLVERLKKQFPEVQFEVSTRPALRVFSNNSEQFVTWLNAISYTDSMVPAIRWSMVAFCVGIECPTDNVMSAELTAETINISQPEGSPVN